MAHALVAVVDKDGLGGFVVAHLDGLIPQIGGAFVAFGVDGEHIRLIDFAISFDEKYFVAVLIILQVMDATNVEVEAVNGLHLNATVEVIVVVGFDVGGGFLVELSERVKMGVSG